MTEELISIVLPIYNVEKYLVRCIKSVVNQSYRNLEIILVDDGSLDQCPRLCEKWAKKDNRIKVVHKENAGLGMARNTGIENATGEYICFFDSDDYVALDAIEKAYAQIKKYNAELVLFGFCNVDSDGKTKKCTIPQTEKNFYDGASVQTYVLPNLIAPDPATGEKTNLWMSAWACMYSMKAIRRANWRFVSERQYISEDVYSLLYLYKDINSVAILSETLYFYCENSVSLTHTYRKDRYEKNKFCYDACQEVCRKLGYNQDVKDRLGFQYVSNIIGALKIIVKADDDISRRKQNLKDIIADNHFQTVIHGMDIRKESITRCILIEAMRRRQISIVYHLVCLKS